METVQTPLEVLQNVSDTSTKLTQIRQILSEELIPHDTRVVLLEELTHVLRNTWDDKLREEAARYIIRLEPKRPEPLLSILREPPTVINSGIRSAAAGALLGGPSMIYEHRCVLLFLRDEEGLNLRIRAETFILNSLDIAYPKDIAAVLFRGTNSNAKRTCVAHLIRILENPAWKHQKVRAKYRTLLNDYLEHVLGQESFGTPNN